MRIEPFNVRNMHLKQDLLRIGVLTLIVVILWISVLVNEAYTKKVITEDMQSRIKEFDTSLDLSVIQDLPNRYSPAETFDKVTIPITDQNSASVSADTIDGI